MHHLARERIGMASEKMKTRYDTRATGHDFHEGDKVWLWNPKRCKGLSPKLQTNWEGPYTVLKRLNGVVVWIQKSPHSKPKCLMDLYYSMLYLFHVKIVLFTINAAPYVIMAIQWRTWRNIGGKAKLQSFLATVGGQFGDFGDRVGEFGTLWNLLESSRSLH
ncbi:kinectin [Trichonephila clavipes]|nr:kinectin [Trichonephila clavipes]